MFEYLVLMPLAFGLGVYFSDKVTAKFAEWKKMATDKLAELKVI